MNEQLLKHAKSGDKNAFQIAYNTLNKGAKKDDWSIAFNAAQAELKNSVSSGVSSSTGGGLLGDSKSTGFVEMALGKVNDATKFLATQSQRLFASGLGKDDGNDTTANKIFEMVQEGGLNPIKLMKTAISDMWGAGLDQIKSESVLLSDVNTKTGISGQLSETLRKDMIAASVEAKRYGFDLSNIGDMYTTLVKDSGKFALINEDTIKSAVPVAAALNMSLVELAGSIGKFEEVGLGADKTTQSLGDATTRLISLGLSAQKVTTAMRDNIGKLNEYGFKNGVKGLEDMSKKAVEFRMSMEESFKIAEKVMNPENAIDMVANLQVLGGAIGDFNDPLKLMYMATNNVEGLQDALIGASSSLATYNQEQGRFEITGINLRRGKAMADAMGISYQELSKGAIAAAERSSAASAIMSRGLKLDDKQTEFLTNISRMQGGEMKIVIPKSLASELNGATEISLDKMTDSQAKVLLANQKAFESMDVKNIAMSQLTETQQMSRGIDVIAAYYKIIGARASEAALKAGGGKQYDELNKAIASFKIGDVNKTAEDIATATANKVTSVKTGISTGIESVKGILGLDTKQPPPPPPYIAASKLDITHTHKYEATSGYMDAFNRENVKNPTLVGSWTERNVNEYTNPKVITK
jgi:hypothetical protein